MSRSFAAMHADHLDPDRHFINDEGDAWTGDCDPPEYGWILSCITNGETKRIGVFQPFDGQDVMGCDMDEWMRENGHYGNGSPDAYEWDGDAESVAIMAKHEGMPDFHFEWGAIGE